MITPKEVKRMPSQPEERGQPTRIGLNQTHRSRTRPDQALVARSELNPPLLGLTLTSNIVDYSKHAEAKSPSDYKNKTFAVKPA